MNEKKIFVANTTQYYCKKKHVDCCNGLKISILNRTLFLELLFCTKGHTQDY